MGGSAPRKNTRITSIKEITSKEYIIKHEPPDCERSGGSYILYCKVTIPEALKDQLDSAIFLPESDDIPSLGVLTSERETD